MHKGIGVFDDAMLLQVVVREDCCNYWYNICRMIGVAVGNTEMGGRGRATYDTGAGGC